MNYEYKIKIFNNSFYVIEIRSELAYGGLKKSQKTWAKLELMSSYQLGYSEIGKASIERCKEWLKENHPDLLL